MLSFRGTVCGDNYVNAKIDFTAIPTPLTNGLIGGSCKLFTGCMAHRGFHESYKSMRDQIRSTTLELINKHKADKPSLLVTGISLGGALAALASYDLAVYLRH